MNNNDLFPFEGVIERSDNELKTRTSINSHKHSFNSVAGISLTFLISLLVSKVKACKSLTSRCVFLQEGFVLLFNNEIVNRIGIHNSYRHLKIG